MQNKSDYTFLVKEQDRNMRSKSRNKRLAPPAKLQKGMIMIASISEHQMRKRMHQIKSSEIIKLSGQQKICSDKQRVSAGIYDSSSIDMSSKESSELSTEPEASTGNLAPLTQIFQITIIEWKKIEFITRSNIQYLVERIQQNIRNKICACLIGKRHLYEDI